MRLGVVVNPVAGGGIGGKEIRLIKDTVLKLNPDKVYSSRGLGFEFLKDFKVEEISIPAKKTREDTLQLVKILDDLVDVIAVFGGDGTVSDAASARPTKPLLCIGTGTTNVSPALCNPSFDPEKLKPVVLRGIRLDVKSETRMAFNDVVVGSTILTTIDGNRVQVDAREFMMGRKIVALPRKFRAKVEVGGKKLEGIFGNIFVAFPDSRFLGKGIAGGASLSAFMGFKGVVACVDEGIIVSTYTKDDVRKLEPIKTETISFDDETVKIEANEIISCDGNPVAIGRAEVRIVDRALVVLKEEI